MAESMLAEQKLPSKTLTIEGLGQANVISGVGLCIIIKPLGISNSYYVDEDTHTFKGNYHSMRLTLNMATDTERSAKASDEKSSTSHSVAIRSIFGRSPVRCVHRDVRPTARKLDRRKSLPSPRARTQNTRTTSSTRTSRAQSMDGWTPVKSDRRSCT
ncbi:MAG: hypothetical protein ACLSG5_07845 [Oscillospiraceae bacterium]